MKIKLRSHVWVIEESNDEIIGGVDVFQMDGLIDPWIELENPKFYVTKNIYIDINT